MTPKLGAVACSYQEQRYLYANGYGVLSAATCGRSSETRQWAKGQRAFAVDIDRQQATDNGWIFCDFPVYPSMHPSIRFMFYPLKDICFPDTTPKISFSIHFKHDYVFNLFWLYSKEV